MDLTASLVRVPPPRSTADAPSLSPSRANDFMTCPLLYRFRVVDRLPEAPSPAATRGTVVHAVLERLFDLPLPERTPERAVELVAPAWEGLLESEPELSGLFATTDELAAWLRSAQTLVTKWFDLEDPRRLEPHARELYVQAELEGGLTLRGVVDRLDVAPSGDVRVVDYKTGRSPGAGFEDKALFQMRFYALVWWRLHGRVPRLLQLVYLGDGTVIRYEPDEADVRATERKLLALWRAIETAMRTGDWRPRPSRLCDWCNHQSLCPSFGGTPPPLPDLTSTPAGPVTLPAPSARPN
ncbi:MAG: RecB family exonuclease [Actinomycetales bacterium]